MIKAVLIKKKQYRKYGIPHGHPPYFYIVLTKYQIKLFETLTIVAGTPDNIGVDSKLKCNMKRSSARFALHLVKLDF